MKKLLSVILAIIMTFSVFSCVSVYAVEETTAPTTENTTEGNVTEPSTDEPTTDEPETEPEPQPTYATAISEVTAKVEGVYVKWSCDGEADKYNVYRRAGGEPKPTLIATVTSLDYIDKTVKNNVYYKYHIEAVVDDEIKATSEGVLTKYLKAVKIIEKRLDTTGNAWVGFRWERVEGATGYEVYCRSAGETEYRLVDRAMYPNYINGVTIKSGYHRFAIVAVDGKYKGALDTNGPLFKYFEEPHIYDIDLIENGVKIRWWNCEGATGYRVYRRAGGEKYYTYLCTTTDREYTDTTVEDGKYYRYVVRGVYGTVFGPYDTYGAPLQYVEKVKLEAIANATDGVYVRWTPVKGAKTYVIYRRGAGGRYQQLAFVDASKGNRYKDTTAIPLQYYRYTVEAVSSSRHSKGYDSNGLVIKHNPLGTTWSKTSVLKYYNYYIDQSYISCPDYTITTWQNIKSQSTTGSNNAFVNEFKQVMAAQYFSANDPAVIPVADDPERAEFFPGTIGSSRVKSASVSHKSNCEVVTIVMMDEVSPEKNRSGISSASVNYLDFNGVVEAFSDEGLITSGSSKSTYKNFTIVATFSKDGKLIAATHSCKDVTASMDMNFINGVGNIKYSVKFDTYLKYSDFKY